MSFESHRCSQDRARGCNWSRSSHRISNQGDLVSTRDLVYNLCENNQLPVRHSRVAVYPFVKQGRRNAQLCSQIFPPDEFYHLAEKELLMRFSHGRLNLSATGVANVGPG